MYHVCNQVNTDSIMLHLRWIVCIALFVIDAVTTTQCRSFNATSIDRNATEECTHGCRLVVRRRVNYDNFTSVIGGCAPCTLKSVVSLHADDGGHTTCHTMKGGGAQPLSYTFTCKGDLCNDAETFVETLVVAYDRERGEEETHNVTPVVSVAPPDFDTQGRDVAIVCGYIGLVFGYGIVVFLLGFFRHRKRHRAATSTSQPITSPTSRYGYVDLAERANKNTPGLNTLTDDGDGVAVDTPSAPSSIEGGFLVSARSEGSQKRMPSPEEDKALYKELGHVLKSVMGSSHSKSQTDDQASKPVHM